jgi:RHS repeat-associated protein
MALAGCRWQSRRALVRPAAQRSYTYDPFGAPLQTQPTNSAIERWAGRWNKKHDTTNSLIQMGVRPYDPALGRFLARDPVVGGSLNHYDYAGQDPVNAFDLSGRRPTGISAHIWAFLVAHGANLAIAVWVGKDTVRVRVILQGKRLRGVELTHVYRVTRAAAARAVVTAAVTQAVLDAIEGASGTKIAKDTAIAAVSGYMGWYVGTSVAAACEAGVTDAVGI